MSDDQAWYVVKQNNSQCTIVPANEVTLQPEALEPGESESPLREHWGPYASQQEAIARRVGLIRAGKCQPV